MVFMQAISFFGGFMKKRKKDYIYKILKGILICIVVFCTIRISSEIRSLKVAVESEQKISRIVDLSKIDQAQNNGEDKVTKNLDEKKFAEESWDQLKNENPDFIGYLSFRSGLIEEPVVQSSGDEYYLRRSFFGEWSSQGTPFMDSFCSTDSANITIYGHNVYYDSSAMFSRLEELTDPEKFQKNALLDFYLGDGQLRAYRIAAVYYSTLENAGSPDYSRPDFSSEKDFYDWINQVYSCAVLSSDVPVRYGDHLLTLQTCKRWDENTHIIALFREIRRESY